MFEIFDRNILLTKVFNFYILIIIIIIKTEGDPLRSESFRMNKKERDDLEVNFMITNFGKLQVFAQMSILPLNLISS